MNKRTSILISLIMMACAFRPIMTATQAATPIVNQIQQPAESQETKPECKPLKERIKEKIKACKQYIKQHKYRVIAAALVTGVIAAYALSNHHHNVPGIHRNNGCTTATHSDPLNPGDIAQLFACGHRQCLNRNCWAFNTSNNCPACGALPVNPIFTHCMNADSCPICTEPIFQNSFSQVLPCKHGMHQQCWQDYVASGRGLCPFCEARAPEAGVGIFGRFLTHCRNTEPRTVAFVLDLAINMLRILT